MPNLLIPLGIALVLFGIAVFIWLRYGERERERRLVQDALEYRREVLDRFHQAKKAQQFQIDSKNANRRALGKPILDPKK